MTLSVRRLDGKAEIYGFLSEDRLYAAYAICDLDPIPFKQCEWHASSKNGRLTALGLCFKGLPPDRVFLMGPAEDLVPILAGALKATRAYFACKPQHLRIVRRFYSLRNVEVMQRMFLRPENFTPAQGPVERLGPRHVSQLQDLYRWYGDVAFAPYQLEQGVFYGVREGGRLVATAGTHLASRTYGLGIVGNVFTHTDYRGKGLATICTSAVIEELLSQSLDVVLNVGQTNEAASGVYRRLGFQVHCLFIEALGVRREAGREQTATTQEMGCKAADGATRVASDA
jgi:GNAT superfamily N-acetyltransferase